MKSRWSVPVILLIIVLLNYSQTFAQTEREYTFAVAWSPSGSMIAYSTGPQVCNTALRTVSVVNAVNGEIVQTLPVGDCTLRSLDWSPDNSRLAGASGDSEAFRVWDVTTGIVLTTGQLPGRGASSVRWHPTTDQLLVAFPSNGVSIFDSNTGQFLRTMDVGGTVADWNPSGARFVTGSGYNNNVYVGDTTTGQLLMTLTGHSAAVINVDWSPDGDRLASLSTDNTIRIWNAHTSQQLQVINVSDAARVRWSPTSIWIAVASFDGFVRIFEAASGQTLDTYVYPGVVFALDWSPDSTQIVIGGTTPSDSDPIQIVTFTPPQPTPEN